MTYDAPVDSTDARERRELEALREQQSAHACADGWIGTDQDERPIACARCRPHLVRVACWLCSSTAGACDMKRDARHGPCCDHCDHRPARRSASDVLR